MIEYDPMRTNKGRVVKCKTRRGVLLFGLGSSSLKAAMQLEQSIKRMNRAFNASMNSLSKSITTITGAFKGEKVCLNCARLGYSCPGITPRLKCSCDQHSFTEKYPDYTEKR